MNNNIIKTIAAHTLGCKVNQYDTQAMLELFVKEGYKIIDFNEKADIYLVNTCTVTSSADKKSRQTLRQAQKKNNSIVIAAGCFSQRTKEKALEFCDIAIGTDERNNVVNLVKEFIEKKNNNLDYTISSATDDLDEYERLFVSQQYGHTRVHMKIQEGCNNYCAYCIIPSVRGDIRSRTLGDIKTEATSLYKNKCMEVILTGINLSSYGLDQKTNPSLYDVVSVIEKCGIKRIRLGSIDPGTFLKTPKLLEKKDVLCPHFHLSLQSGCDKTLKAMNRWYNTNEYFNEVNFIRKTLPNVAITTDIIVGFPGESEDDFNETYDFVEKIKLSRIHVFPYSPRPDTKAYSMKNQIDKKTKNERVHKLIELGKSLEQEYMNRFINKNLNVLFETSNEKIYEGYSPEYIKVKVKSDNNIKSTIMSVSIIGKEEDCLIGKIN